ncbi:anti-sigma factor family protein [Raineyella sp.]|uniref:Putative zinc-finger domain-containing protein n=1 Tax=bioreactor metagenome TaxID=1076179 RepID=A0A645BKH4_9ZZZZ|nr:zf-HC2 domain-containing protein [Raineyella sp.]MEA5154689.1 zf-HC2 domain-containing protein [Raineyella sp.]
MTEMDCRGSRELICAYLDEELDDDLAAAVYRHLRGCPDCDDLYRVQRTVKDLLHRSCADSPAAPAGLRDRVWAAVLAQCGGARDAAVTINATRTTISTTMRDAAGVLVRRTTVTGTLVRTTYRTPPRTPGEAGQPDDPAPEQQPPRP